MKKIKLLAAMAMLAMVSVFSGCNNAAFNSDNQKEERSAEMSEEMAFVFKFPGPDGRTAYYDPSEATKYTAQILETDAFVEGNPGQTVSLKVQDEGIYTINVKAYNDSILIAEGQETAEIKRGNGRVKVKIRLIPKEKPDDIDVDLEFEWVIPTPSVPDTPYEVLPAGTNGTAGPNATYVLFGEYPQSLKDDSVTVDESVRKVCGSYIYCKGSDGAWYATYERKYYKVEPVKWRVLTTDFDHDGNSSTPGKKLLLAEIAIANCEFYNGGNDRYTENGELIYKNNYEYSYARALLNGLLHPTSTVMDKSVYNTGFLQMAFTESEQALIATTTLLNNAVHSNPDGSPNALENGVNQYASNEVMFDKIFLLSLKEVSNTEYFDMYGRPDSKRARKASDLARAQGARMNGENCFWALRSPAPNSATWLRLVGNDGRASTTGTFYSGVTLVPALCID